MISRTFCALRMNGMRLVLCALALQAAGPAAAAGARRRLAAATATMPSKGGWRPVVGSGGLLYGSFGGSPLQSSPYKIPVPVLDMFPSSARPISSRDAGKLTSIAQSYRPTTTRTVPSSQTQAHQPISSYHNPFAIQNNNLGIHLQNGLNYYKHLQSYPLDSVLIRNPHNPYAARPVFQKFPQKFKQQQLQNNVLQQLTSIQPLQFAQYQTSKPIDIFGKPVEGYARPAEHKDQNKGQGGGVEVYKQDVYKLPDSDTASQSVHQQVKTAQQQHLGVQQNLGIQNQIYNPYGQYSFQNAALPPSLLGSFGNIGLQTVKGNNPFQFPSTKPTFFPQPSRQTIFNSFSYKTTPFVFSSTTPRLPTSANPFQFTSTLGDFKITPVPNTKASIPPKIDPNAGVKDSFKPSPQDPFSKYHSNGFNKVVATTYNPLQTTANNVYEYSFQAQNAQNQNYYNQPNINYNFDKKQKVQDSVPAGGNQQINKQYANPPSRPDLEPVVRPTYEVTEATDADVYTRASAAPWSLTSQPNDNPRPTEDAQKQEYSEYGLQHPTPLPALPEEYAIVTEAEKGYDNSLSYDGHVESQSRRPLGEEFEPIGNQKLKDYYTYKVSTPSYDDIHIPRRTKKTTTESSRLSTQETTTASTLASEEPVEALPTLPPNRHFKRPSTPEPPSAEKDRIRKRTKLRRRRPTLAQTIRNKEETSTGAHYSTQTTDAPINEEVHTIKPRVRPTSKLQTAATTVSAAADITSALPMATPTSPTIIKKKLAHRRLITTTPSDRFETTTAPTFKIYEASKESQIMKIANRQQYKSTSPSYDTQDYTHKQDEKDTPTSDVEVSLNDGLKTTSGTDLDLEFAFHKDVKPIEAKLEPVTNYYRETTTYTYTDAGNEVTTYSPRLETTSSPGRVPRPRLRNKYNRPKFSVKDYKNRLGSTTTTEKPVENTPKLRFPQRKPYTESDSETTTERRKFMPKDPRYKTETTEGDKQHDVRPTIRQRQTTAEVESSTKVSARIRNGNRRTTKPMDETTEPLPTTVQKRPLRKKIKDSEVGESVQDAVTETIYEPKDITSERTRSESAIMKIADKKHHDHMEHLFEHSKRVSDLTLAASKDYNKPGMFKSVPNNSRRIPNYFTIATDDPILPIEAFFPQLNQKKET